MCKASDSMIQHFAYCHLLVDVGDKVLVIHRQSHGRQARYIVVSAEIAKQLLSHSVQK